jgi:Tfp pilus assembly protein PilN
LERTIKFHLSNKAEASSQSKLPVFISGILLDDEALYKSFTDNLGFAVFPATPPLTYPAQMDSTNYMVNAGLILKSLPINGEAGLSLVNLNALPQTYAGKHLPVTPVLYGIGALLVVGIIVSGIVLVKNMNGQTESLQGQLTTVNQNLTQRMNLQQSLTDSVTSLEKNLSTSTPALADLNATQASFVSQQDSINGNLDLVVGKLSFNMTLTSIQYTSESLTVLGTAPSEAEVRDYARALESSGSYSEIIISRIVEDQQINNIVDFTLILKEKG